MGIRYFLIREEAAMIALYTATVGFQAPVTHVGQRASPQMGVEDMVGKYSVADTVFDPLGLADKYDLNWLREAELK